MPPSTLDILEWLRFGATIVTPVAVVFLAFWLNARASSRKTLMENIETKIERLSKKIDDGQVECREDIQAVVTQVSAFQREVAERYPLRREMEEGLKAIREDLRFYYSGRSHDDPSRRR